MRSGAALQEALTLPLRWTPTGWSSSFARMLRKGVVHWGDPSRLVDAMVRARAGQPITVVAVGASVTALNGGVIGAWQDQYPGISYISPLHKCTGRCVVPGWLLPAFEAIVPSAQRHPNSSWVNAGHAGSAITDYLECTRNVLPTRADVLIVDAASVEAAATGVEKVPLALHPSTLLLAPACSPLRTPSSAVRDARPVPVGSK